MITKKVYNIMILTKLTMFKKEGSRRALRNFSGQV